MPKITTALMFALVMSLPLAASRAGLDTESAPSAPAAFELIVVEADGCIYCNLFRRDVLPAYETSDQGKAAPVRFVDVNDVDAAHLEVTSPVDIVPTFIVVKSKHEVGRIAGYVGPENFFHSINHLIASAP